MQKKFYFGFITILLLINSYRKELIDPVIDESRLVVIELNNYYRIVPLDNYNTREKRQDDTMPNSKIITFDVYADNIIKIFKELAENHFTLNNVGCYCPRNIRNGKSKSLHAYASAIDINSKQNPYINLYVKSIIPEPVPEDWNSNKDYYIKRNIVRDGMITEKEAEIFYKNGFTQWGGSTVWKGCPDYMHFQVSLAIAKIVTKLPKEQAKIFWNKYLENPKKVILDSFFNQDINEQDIDFDKIMKKLDDILKQ